MIIGPMKFGACFVSYERRGNAHQLRCVDTDGAKKGPWTPITKPVTYVTMDNLKIVGQAYTELLPTIFEMRTANDHVLSLIQT